MWPTEQQLMQQKRFIACYSFEQDPVVAGINLNLHSEVVLVENGCFVFSSLYFDFEE